MSIQIILLLALLIRLIGINQSFWLDEATSVTAASKSFTEIFDFIKGDFHPPLYYLVLKIWTSFFGVTEFSVRMLSVLFGLGATYITYLIGKRFLNENSSRLTALMLALSPLFIYYTQEARMYSQLTFFVILTIYLIFIKRWFAASVALLFAIYTDYVALVLIPIVLIFIPLKQLFLLVIGLAMVFPLFINQIISGLGVKANNPQWWSILGGNSIKEIALFVIKTITGRIPFEKSIIFMSLVGINIISLFFLLYKAAMNLKLSKRLFIWFIVPIILSLLISFIVPIFTYFRFVFVLPVFYLLLNVGLSQLPNKIQKLFLILILCSSLYFAANYFYNPKNYREDWRSLVNFVDSDVYFVSNSQMEAFNWYAKSKNIKARDPLELDSQNDHIWLMRYVHDIFDPEDNLVKKVESLGYTIFTEYNFNGVVIRKYEKNRN